MADGPRSTLTQAQIPAHRPHLPLRPRHRSTLSTGVRGPESTSPQPARMRSRGPDCHYRSRSSTVLDGAASSVPGLRAASPSAVPGPSDRVRIEQRSAPARTSWGAEGGKIGWSAPTSPTTGAGPSATASATGCRRGRAGRSCAPGGWRAAGGSRP